MRTVVVLAFLSGLATADEVCIKSASAVSAADGTSVTVCDTGTPDAPGDCWRADVAAGTLAKAPPSASSLTYWSGTPAKAPAKAMTSRPRATLSPDGKTILFVDWDIAADPQGQVATYDAKSGKRIMQLKKLDADNLDAEFAGDRLIVSRGPCCEEGRDEAWSEIVDARSGKWIGKVGGKQNPLKTWMLAAAPAGGDLWWFGGNDAALVLQDVQTGDVKQTIPAQTPPENAELDGLFLENTKSGLLVVAFWNSQPTLSLVDPTTGKVTKTYKPKTCD